MGGWLGGWVLIRLKVENHAICGPTCKIARFQEGLKFPSWTECGKTLAAEGLKVSQYLCVVFQYILKTKASANVYHNPVPPPLVNLLPQGM